jgi:hypothetical protein
LSPADGLHSFMCGMTFKCFNGFFLFHRGCAYKVGTSASGYAGTIKFASDRVLELLDKEEPVDVLPADDLQSLVSVVGVQCSAMSAPQSTPPLGARERARRVCG